jgi:hypothetical protein
MTYIKTKIFNSAQNTLLAIIAICLCLIVIKLYTPKAYADDSHIINRVLFCIDGSTISSGRLTTYCNR